MGGYSGGSPNINLGGNPEFFDDLGRKINPWDTRSKREQADAIDRATGDRPQMGSYKSINTQRTVPDGTQKIKGPLGIQIEVPKTKKVDAGLANVYKVKAGPKVQASLINAPDAVKAGAVKAGSVQAGNVKAGQLDTRALMADPRAIDAMRERALATGPSPWLQMQTERQGIEELSARDQAAQQALSGAATARSQLAMRGGLGSGASQRIAMSSARNMNAARQGIGRAGQLDRLNLAIADDQTKTGLLGQTAGLDLARAEQSQGMEKYNISNTLDADKYNVANTLAADQFNVGTALDADKYNVGTTLDADKYNVGMTQDTRAKNAGMLLDAEKYNSGQMYDVNKTNAMAAIGDVQGQNAFNAGKYQNDMMGYAAGKQAAATARGGKK